MRTIVPGVRTYVLSILFLFLFIPKSYSQSFSALDGLVEFGANVGPMFFLGDLGGNAGRGKGFLKDVNTNMVKMSKGIYVSVYPQECIGFRLAFNHGQVEGADSTIRDEGGEEINRMVRNLHFRSNVTEAYLAAEIYPSVFFERFDGLQGKFRPYGLAGVGVFRFNPQGQFENTDGSKQWVDLKPLRLEGQGMKEFPDRPEYSLTQIEIPLGAGFKWYPSETMFVGFEVVHRTTFTDYMDDVSRDYIDPMLYEKYLEPEHTAVAFQMYNRGYGALSRPTIGEGRGNSKNNDHFFSSTIRLGWRINTTGIPRQAMCPRF